MFQNKKQLRTLNCFWC